MAELADKEQLEQTIRNEIEYILNDDTAGEVRVTYSDGHSEIKDAKVLLADDLFSLFKEYAEAQFQRGEKAGEAKGRREELNWVLATWPHEGIVRARLAELDSAEKPKG